MDKRHWLALKISIWHARGEWCNRDHDEFHLDANKIWELAFKDLLVVLKLAKYKEQTCQQES